MKIICILISITPLLAFSTISSKNVPAKQLTEKLDLTITSRRNWMNYAAVSVGLVLLSPIQANAKEDCVSDCLKNCKLIAPKDPAYCVINCKDYCEQDDRTDGLTGSVSSSGGEVGILGQGTVPKGQDKPPSINLPGLDFTSDKGRKLIGY